MGTIGDLLGIDLSAAFAQNDSDANNRTEEQESAPAAPSLAGEDTPHSASRAAEETPDAEALNPRHEAVLAAIIAETNLDPSQARLDLTLMGDLDLDDLGLYAVVAAIEHELHCTFTDEVVRSWQTLGDMLSAAEQTAKTTQSQR